MDGKLLERIEAAIADAKFDAFEYAGFKEQPRLALTTGAAIGYRIGLDDMAKKLHDLTGRGDDDQT